VDVGSSHVISSTIDLSESDILLKPRNIGSAPFPFATISPLISNTTYTIPYNFTYNPVGIVIGVKANVYIFSYRNGLRGSFPATQLYIGRDTTSYAYTIQRYSSDFQEDPLSTLPIPAPPPSPLTYTYNGTTGTPLNISTIPQGYTRLDYILCGGGGGGGGYDGGQKSGGGGGLGECISGSITVVSGQSIHVEFGIGGSVDSNSDGYDGVGTILTLGLTDYEGHGGGGGRKGTGPVSGAGGTSHVSGGGGTAGDAGSGGNYTGGDGGSSTAEHRGGGGGGAGAGQNDTGQVGNGGNGSSNGLDATELSGGKGGDGYYSIIIT